MEGSFGQVRIDEDIIISHTVTPRNVTSFISACPKKFVCVPRSCRRCADGEQWVACTVTRQSEEKDREGHVRRLPGQFDVHVHDTRLGRAAGDADQDVGKVSYRDLRRVDLGGHTGVGEGHVAEGVPPRA